MQIQETAQQLLGDYGKSIGLPHLHFEPHGCARLEFEDALAVDFEIDVPSSSIQVYHVLGEVPVSGQSQLFRRLLEANFFCKETRTATLSIDPARSEVVLSRQVVIANTTADQMATVMQEFVGNAQSWRRRYQSGELSAEALPLDSASTESNWAQYVRG